MRYVVQFVIPILIVLAVVYLATRKARVSNSSDDPASDRGTFLTILALGTTTAIVVGYFVYSYGTSA